MASAQQVPVRLSSQVPPAVHHRSRSPPMLQQGHSVCQPILQTAGPLVDESQPQQLPAMQPSLPLLNVSQPQQMPTMLPPPLTPSLMTWPVGQAPLMQQPLLMPVASPVTQPLLLPAAMGSRVAIEDLQNQIRSFAQRMRAQAEGSSNLMHESQ